MSGLLEMPLEVRDDQDEPSQESTMGWPSPPPTATQLTVEVQETPARFPSARGGLELSADPAFGGDATALNPELLLVAAASSCQPLSFLAVAARARIDVRGYEDHGEGVMPEDDPPVRLTAIVLRPVIRVGPGTAAARVRHLVEVVHRECSSPTPCAPTSRWSRRWWWTPPEGGCGQVVPQPARAWPTTRRWGSGAASLAARNSSVWWPGMGGEKK